MYSCEISASFDEEIPEVEDRSKHVKVDVMPYNKTLNLGAFDETTTVKIVRKKVKEELASLGIKGKVALAYNDEVLKDKIKLSTFGQALIHFSVMIPWNLTFTYQKQRLTTTIENLQVPLSDIITSNK